MGLERAELIARLTARDRVKDLFDALADGSSDGAVRGGRPGRLRPRRARTCSCTASPRRARTAAGADWEAVSTRLAARLRGRDQVGFFDAGRDGLRAVVLMPDAARRRARDRGLRRGRGGRARRARRERAGRAASPRAARRCARRRAPRSSRARCAPGGGALGYEQLGAYKYLVHLQVEESPRDRHWTAVEALLAHDRQRRTALLDTLEEYLARRRSVADTARTLYIHPNTLRQRLARIERVTGLQARRARTCSRSSWR